MTSIRTIIYLHPSEPPQASWITLDNGNNIIDAVIHGELSQLAAEGNVTVVVPAQDVVLTHATLPKLNRPRLMQALPFALEEQLIDEIDALHFAIGEYQPDGTLPVAVVAKDKLSAWLGLCQQFNIRPSRMISSIFALPYEEKKWFVSIDEENCAVRTGKFTGFACEQSNLPMLLELARDPEVIIETLNFPGQSFLDTVANAIAQYPSINLLQGQFQAQSKASGIKNSWLIAGYATLAWLGLVLFSHVISLLILHYQSSQLEAQINTIYQHNFPNSSAVVAPRERMQGKLGQQENLANKNDFLALLADVGKNITNSPIHLKSFDFRDDILNLDLTAETFDDLDTFTKKLTAYGLSVKQQSATIAGTEVKASLLIQRGMQ